MTARGDFAAAADNLSRSLSQLAGTTAALVRSGAEQAQRSALAERRRGVWMLCSVLALLIWLTTASLFAGVAIMAAFRDTHPALAAAGVAAGFLVLAGTSAWALWFNACRRATAGDWITRLIILFAEYRRWRSR